MAKNKRLKKQKDKMIGRVNSLITQEVKNYTQSAASTDKQWSKKRFSTPNSVKTDIEDNLSILHGRGRYEYQSNAIARGIVDKIKTNAVGSGLQMNPNIDKIKLGLTDEQVTDWQRKTRAEFELWSNSKDCDAGRRLTFGQLQILVMSSALVNGDIFTALPRSKRIGQPYDLRVQLIEADRVRTPSDKSMDSNIVGGIRMGALGESISAFIHNGFEYDYGVDGDKYVEVPFYGNNGNPTLLQFAQDWERPNQVRGVTVFAPIMEVLAQIDRYNKAELMANIISSFFTVVIETERQNPLADGVPLDQQQDLDDTEIALGSGNIIQAREGESFKPINPARTNSSFGSVMENFIRLVGIGSGLPYEVLISHFQSSYSAARGALQEAWKMYSMRRTWLIDSFCQPIYELWLTEAVAKGRVEAKGFFDDPAIKKAWCGATWIGPAQTSLNPAQEANANKINLENGLDSRANIIQRTIGVNPDTMFDTVVREHKQRVEAGLTENLNVTEVVIDEE
jgi:lambda family phage portal protein